MAVQGQMPHVQRSSVSSLFVTSLYYFEFSLGRPRTKHLTPSTVNRFEAFSRQAGWNRLHHQQTHAKVKRTGSFRIRPKNMRLTSHCRAESRAGTPCNSFCLPRRLCKSHRVSFALLYCRTAYPHEKELQLNAVLSELVSQSQSVFHRQVRYQRPRFSPPSPFMRAMQCSLFAPAQDCSSCGPFRCV
jgi:hypothetical protein